MKDLLDRFRYGRARVLLSSYIDGELSERDRLRVERHLSGCAECRAELESLRLTVELARGLPEVEPSRSFTLSAAPEAERGGFGWIANARMAAAVAAVLLVAIMAGAAGLLRMGPQVEQADTESAAAMAAAPAPEVAAAQAPAMAPVVATAPSVAPAPMPAVAAEVQTEAAMSQTAVAPAPTTAPALPPIPAAAAPAAPAPAPAEVTEVQAEAAVGEEIAAKEVEAIQPKSQAMMADVVEETSTPTATATPHPTPTTTATPTRTPTPEPTATATPHPTPTPTWTPTPEPTATAAPTATFEPTQTMIPADEGVRQPPLVPIGVGVGALLLALAAWWVRRRLVHSV